MKLHLPLPIALHCSHYHLNHSPPPCHPWKNCLPRNQSLGAKKVGDQCYKTCFSRIVYQAVQNIDPFKTENKQTEFNDWLTLLSRENFLATVQGRGTQADLGGLPELRIWRKMFTNLPQTWWLEVCKTVYQRRETYTVSLEASPEIYRGFLLSL